ncbi:MAG: DUF4145 domain-containing protein [Methanosarcinales archaeon]|nr:DUF4145 domain-containing protein [Methanosarcinales archaeon]
MGIEQYLCPNPDCKKMIFYLVWGVSWSSSRLRGMTGMTTDVKKRFLVYPKGSNRPPVPPQVPQNFAEDYMEACVVLPDSSKASAALSRRCLQSILRDVANVTPGNLANEIQQVIGSKTLPTHLVKALDMVREIGNFAAHPTKSEKTGEIIPVEPQEAEWNLDVLESLFGFYFVQPEILKSKKDTLNKKLKEAGKKEMK